MMSFVSIFNTVLTFLFGLLYGGVKWLGPFWSLAGISLLVGLLMVWIFGKVSNQDAVQKTRGRLSAELIGLGQSQAAGPCVHIAELPVRAIREQVASAIDMVVHQQRFKDGSRRITHITEVVGMEGDIITMQDLFLFDHSLGLDDQGRSQGSLKPTGIRPKFYERLRASGMQLPASIFQTVVEIS
jgi:hypothetical protein